VTRVLARPVEPARGARRGRWSARGWLVQLAALVFCLFFALPFVWMFMTSIRTAGDLFTVPVHFVPQKGITFQPYLDVMTMADFGRYFVNSTYIAGLTTIISTLLSILAALGFARYRMPGGRLLMMSTLLSQLFPLVLLVPPMFIVMRTLHILDTPASLIIAYISFALPYSVWLLTGYLRTIPVELEEAAMVDGATRLGAYFRITLPLAIPGIIATFIYCFILSWDEFLFATTFISNPNLRTLPLGLYSFIGEFTVQWNLLMAGAVVTTLPVAILFVFLQRYLIAGLTSSAIKG
jgi:multiple sugar transport system permease protein